jgi:hypothetical protein
MWMAFVLGSITTTTALIRFLIAIPVASIMLVALRTITAGYHSLSHTDRHHQNPTPPE